MWLYFKVRLQVCHYLMNSIKLEFNDLIPLNTKNGDGYFSVDILYYIIVIK